MADTLECYRALGLEPGASAELIRKAYIDLLKTWDPNRYVNNPPLLAETSKKRKEIEEAYQALRFFLPELQGPSGDEAPTRAPARDYNELAVEPRVELSKAFMGILVALALVGLFAFAAHLYRQSKAVTSHTVPVEPAE